MAILIDPLNHTITSVAIGSDHHEIKRQLSHGDEIVGLDMIDVFCFGNGDILIYVFDGRLLKNESSGDHFFVWEGLQPIAWRALITSGDDRDRPMTTLKEARRKVEFYTRFDKAVLLPEIDAAPLRRRRLLANCSRE
jgi:hypothetical protein